MRLIGPRLAEAGPKAWGSLAQPLALVKVLGALLAEPRWALLCTWVHTGSSLTTHEIGHSYADGHLLLVGARVG